ncbi:MAG: hypothetical protein JJE41_02020 [Candidatus Heimdallarchaeota archaeon]|nr:hypothetical protein [Candidatus Heimdallarchaeota archaeon]
MSIKENDLPENRKLSEGETYFSYYLKQRSMWISLLLSTFLLLDIITIFVKTNYSFTKIFAYFGILMLLLAGGALTFIYFEENFFWALLGSLVLGVMPLIEIIIVLTKALTNVDLGLAILSLLIILLLCVLPVILVSIRFKIKNKQSEK